MILPVAFQRIISWRPGGLARGTLLVSLGMGVRTGIQAFVFLGIARILQTESYGAFCAVLALAGATGSLSGMGASMLIIRDTSRDAALFPETWGSYLFCWSVTTPILFGLFTLVAVTCLPSAIPLSIIVAIGLAEIALVPLSTASGQAFQAFGRMKDFSRLLTFPVAFRLAGVMLLIPVSYVSGDSERLLIWSVLYFVAAACAAGYAFRQVMRHLGAPQYPAWRSIPTTMREGFPFAVGGAALRVYADIDKTMISSMISLEVTGFYSAGYRVMDMAAIPVTALVETSAPRFFREGMKGKEAGFRYLCRILPVPLLYATTAAILLYIGAGVIPLILGETYGGAVDSLRWLAWLPLFSTLRYLFQTVLGTSGHQAPAVVLVLVGALSNVALNFWMIPLWGWRGAIVATYLAEAIMMLGMWSAIAHGHLFKGAQEQG